MRRILALSGLILALGALPFSAFALGLGTIHLHSALGQKLDADIALIDVDAQSASALKVALASRAQYKRAQVARSSTVDSLRFKVVRGANGYHVHVTSSRPVREPFLTFLISANWSSGQMVRQYTVLLNPPNYAGAGGASAASTSANLQRGAAQAASRSHSGGNAQPASTVGAGSAGASGNYGPIKRGDTLWGIARQTTAGGPADVDQMMIAIYRTNPNAFSGNINRLRAGRMLTIPSRTDAGRIDRRAAIEAVKKAHARYVARTAPAPGKTAAAASSAASHKTEQVASRPDSSSTPAGKPAGATNAKTNAAGADESSGRAGGASGAHLTLLAPGAAAAGKAAVLGNDAKQATQIARLRKQVTQAKQKAAHAADQNASLSSKVDKLQGQVDKQKRLLSVKDNQLSQLQKRVRQQQAKANDTSTGDRIVAVVTTPVFLIGVLVVIVLLIIAAVIRKQQQKRADDDGAVPVAATAGGSVRNRWAVHADAAAEPIAEEHSNHATESVEAAAPDEPADAADPIAEADFHLDYGLYDQAAEVVRQGIEAEPARSELKLKLFEIYFAAGDATAFSAAAQEYAPDWGADHPVEWEEVTAIGRKLAPNEPLFAAGQEGARPHERLDPPTELPTEVGAETATEVPDIEDVEQEEAIADPRDEAFDIDFDLDEPVEPIETEAGDEPEPRSEEQPESEVAEPPIEVTASEDGPEAPREAGAPESVDLSSLEAELYPETSAEGPHNGQPSLLDTQTEFEDAIRELSEFVDTNFPGNSAEDTSTEIDESVVADAEAVPATETAETPAFEAEEDVLADEDEADELDTKLDLARAYMDMGDPEGARSILEEVIEEGAADHQERARTLLDKVG
jgi:pilus assembly protein FimV